MKIEKSPKGSYQLSRRKKDFIEQALRKKAEKTLLEPKEVKKKDLRLQEEEEKFTKEPEELEEEVLQDISELQRLLDEFITILQKMNMAEKLFNQLKMDLKEMKNNKKH